MWIMMPRISIVSLHLVVTFCEMLLLSRGTSQPLDGSVAIYQLTAVRAAYFFLSLSIFLPY